VSGSHSRPMARPAVVTQFQELPPDMLHGAATDSHLVGYHSGLRVWKAARWAAVSW
jgi:hypothetical protein